MSCESCAGAMARNDQLERELEHATRYQQRLMDRFQRAEERVKVLERELRETKDELRQRREVQGYLPELDTPLDS